MREIRRFVSPLRGPTVTAVAAALLAVGCRQSGPRVEILSPTNGAVVGPNVKVTLRAVGPRVVPANGMRAAGEGHHHVFVDMDPTPRDSIIPGATRRLYHVGTGADTVWLTGLAPGAHRLITVFAYGDHLPIKEVAADTVRIVVRVR